MKGATHSFMHPKCVLMLLVKVGCRSCETQAPWMALRVFPQVCCPVWYPNLPRPVASSSSPPTECDGRSSIITAQRTSHRAVGVHILDLDSTQVRRPTTAVRSLSQRVPPKVFPFWFSRPNGHLLNGYEQIPKRGGCDDGLHSRGVAYQVNPDEQQNS